MTSNLLESLVRFSPLLVTLQILASFGFLRYCTRRKLRGLRAHPLALAACFALSAATLASLVSVAARELGDESRRDFFTLGEKLLTWGFSLGAVLWFLRETHRKFKACAEVGSPAEMEELRTEEALARLNPLGAWASLAIYCMFILTFFGTIACMDFCLGQGYEKSYSFMAGFLGWFTGLWLMFLRVMTAGPRRIAVQVLTALSVIAAIWLTVSYWRPMGVVALFAICLLGGGSFAVVYLNAEAGAFVEPGTGRQLFAAMFRIPTRTEFQARKAKAKKRFSIASSVPKSVKAEEGDPTAQLALASYYEQRGVLETDFAEAYAWYHLAAEGSSLAADQFCGELKKRMSPEQIAAGEKRAGELRAQIATKLKSGGK